PGAVLAVARLHLHRHHVELHGLRRVPLIGRTAFARSATGAAERNLRGSAFVVRPAAPDPSPSNHCAKGVILKAPLLRAWSRAESWRRLKDRSPALGPAPPKPRRPHPRDNHPLTNVSPP